jgi:hypothetical protein
VNRRRTSFRVALLFAVLLGLLALVAAQLLTRPAGAVGLLESRYQVWPPAIVLPATPVAGEYMLIVHDAAGDRLYASWHYEAGWHATIPLPLAPWAGDSYHVQVMEAPDATMILAETTRYPRAAWVMFLPFTGTLGE